VPGFARPEIPLAQPAGGSISLPRCSLGELAPSSRKVRTALRMTTIGTLGAGLVASCHITNQLGTYQDQSTSVYFKIPLAAPSDRGRFLRTARWANAL
jgi:hypothetical protein